jgi:hypothetical protein
MIFQGGNTEMKKVVKTNTMEDVMYRALLKGIGRKSILKAMKIEPWKKANKTGRAQNEKERNGVFNGRRS